MSSSDHLVRQIADALARPADSLGRVEANVEAKLILPVLQLLGWNPASDLHWGFQIAAHRFSDRPRSAAGEVDLLVGGPQAVAVAVEAKYWQRPLLQAARIQILGYRDAVGAPRGLLTNGHRWVVFGADGDDELQDATLAPGIGGAEALVEGLRPFISRDVVNQQPWRDARVWAEGMSIRAPRVSQGETVISWDADDHADPLTAALAGALRRLVEDRPHVLLAETTRSSLIIRATTSTQTQTIVEWPAPGALVRRRASQRLLGIPDELIDAYEAAAARLETVDDIPAVIAALKHMTDCVT